MGRRVTFWLPDDHEWIMTIVQSVRKEAEKNGHALSEADVLLAALSEFWKEVKPAKQEHKRRKRKIVRGKLRRVIYFRKKEHWIPDAIDEIVRVKTLSGMKTAFSFELTRLLKNALSRTLTGAKIDKRILTKEK